MTTNTTKLRVGVAGLGVAAAGTVKELSRASNVELIAAADVRPQALTTFKERYGGRTYDSVGEDVRGSGHRLGLGSNAQQVPLRARGHGGRARQARLRRENLWPTLWTRPRRWSTPPRRTTCTWSPAALAALMAQFRLCVRSSLPASWASCRPSRCLRTPTGCCSPVCQTR